VQSIARTGCKGRAWRASVEYLWRDTGAGGKHWAPMGLWQTLQVMGRVGRRSRQRLQLSGQGRCHATCNLCHA